MVCKALSAVLVLMLLSTACSPLSTGSTPEPHIPNPASLYCEQQSNRLQIVTAADGSQTGICIFPDGSTCDEWAYFRGECGPATQSPSSSPSEVATALAIDPLDVGDWWTFTHPLYHFSLKLPEDWTAEEPSDNTLLSGHLLNIHPNDGGGGNIRLTFRRQGEDTLLWPTGVGQGDFVLEGTLEIDGQPAQRVLLVCPTGEVTSIWYHQDEGTPNIRRGDLEFGVIFSAAPGHCDPGCTLDGEVQRVGEMIIASLKVL